MLWTKLMFEPFKEIWENRDYYGYNIRDENAPWYKQVWQTIVHSFGDLTPISVSSAQRAVDTGGTWSKDAVLAVLGFGPAPSYAERSTIQNRISFLKVVKVRSFKARSFATHRRLLVAPLSARKIITQGGCDRNCPRQRAVA
jgi:hypothetical protein